LFSNNNLFSNDNFDIMDINYNQENNFEHSNCNSSITENSKKRLREKENIEDRRDSKRKRYENLKNKPNSYAPYSLCWHSNPIQRSTIRKIHQMNLK
ncbi:12636_t:CDS:2, partial [Dentiscutata erythropus]